MAGVTYLIRMLPLTVFRKEIKSVFIKSFLHYVPYAVLAAMPIPGILSSTGISARRWQAWSLPLSWHGAAVPC